MMNPVNRDLLIKGAEAFGIRLSDEQIDQFDRYRQKLLEWNEKINLTAITEEKDIVIKHFIDSLSVLPYFPKTASSLIDVGTGAGFPGIPLKIVQKPLKVTLLDSLDKRVRFLNDVISEGSFSGIHAIHGRAEDLAQDKNHREIYDIGIARAVASLTVLCEYILPFVKVGGFFIAMKGSDVQDEITEARRAISILGGNLKDVHHFVLPFEEMDRHIILIEKIRQTPTQYPRKSGKPAKSPLK